MKKRTILFILLEASEDFKGPIMGIPPPTLASKSISTLFFAAASFFLINPIKNQFFSKDYKTMKEEEYKKLISSLETK